MLSLRMHTQQDTLNQVEKNFFTFESIVIP